MNQLLTTWILIVSWKIADGKPFYNLLMNGYDSDTPPAGFRYVPLSVVMSTYDPTTYQVLPYETAMAILAGQAASNRSKRGFFGYWSDGSTAEATNEAVTVKQTEAITAVEAKPLTGAEAATAAAAEAEADADLFDQIQSSIANIGENAESGLVKAAPYLPLVTKVAMFIVPGLREYQMLMMAIEVATITSQGYKRYNDGESMTSVASSTAWQMFTMTKRDTGATFGDYAQNVYESLKNALVSRITNIRRPYGDDVTTGTTDISTEQYEMGDGVKIIKTTLTESYGGAQVPEIADDAVGKLTMSDKLKIVQGLHKTIVPKTTLTDDSSDTTSSAAASNESDGGDDNESKIEIDKSLFTKYLNAAMRLQPEFIQKKSGEELVQFLDNMEIKLPSSATIDSSQLFYSMVNTMQFDSSVTDEQKNRLVDVLTKTTNYFINTMIENESVMKQTMN